MIDSRPTLDPTSVPYQKFPDQPWEDLERWGTIERAIRQNSPKTPYTKNWKPIAKNLWLILGHKTFRFCFLKASLVCLTRDTAVIEFENRYKLDHVRDYYMSELRRAIRALHPQVAIIGMKVAPLPALAQGEIFYTRKNPASLSGRAASSQSNGGLV